MLSFQSGDSIVAARYGPGLNDDIYTRPSSPPHNSCFGVEATAQASDKLASWNIVRQVTE